MTAPQPKGWRRAFHRLSGGALLLALLVISTLAAVGLSASVLAGAARSNRDLAQTIETRILLLLERDGLSGLVAEISRVEGALVPGTGDVEFAVWRRVGPDNRLLRETRPGLATALSDAVPGAVERRAIDGRSYDVFAPDIAVESESWDLPMAEVFVSYAVGVPTLQTRSARREVLAVWAGYALAVAVGVALHLDHRRRYRTGLDRINAVLDDFAAGNTSATVAIDTEAPELRRLSDHLSDVLPRFDQLLSDLRALTAHLAHELKTPLQTIRSDVRRLSVAGEVDARRGIAREIDGTIDATDGRLRSVMQLFRLSADVQVALNEGVAFGELITDQVYDFEDRLVDRGRALVVNVAEGIEVTANAPLLELLVANLLSNAVKYAPEQSRIGIDLVHEGDRFKFRVWNTGSAFPEDWMNRPFQRLSRAEAHSDIPGHGLGLALVDVIARRHGFLARTVNGTDPDTGAPLAAVTVQGPCRTFG